MSALPAPTDLTTAALVNPIGLGDPQPLLRWKFPNPLPHPTAAWSIEAASSPEALTNNQPDLWQSGWVIGEYRQQTPYQGSPLSSRSRVHWRVRVRDTIGTESPWSEPASFELGLLHPSDWSAAWIQSHVVGGHRVAPPASYFRQTFHLDHPPIRARLYATALGLVDCEINGQPVSDILFAPGWTDYRKTIQTVTFDVTSLLQPGTNTLGAILGDGWYSGKVGWRTRQFYGTQSALLLQLELTDPDGSHTTITTQPGWKCSTGPILSQDLLAGESYDARLDLGPWSTPAYDDSHWLPAKVTPAPQPTAILTPTAGPFVHRQAILPASTPAPNASSPEFAGARTIIDFGQNLVGRVRLTLSGPAGVVVQLRHAEMLENPTTLHTANLRSAEATDDYTLRGNGTEIFEPRFTFHGFRYLELHIREQRKAILQQVRIEKVEAVVLHSDMPPAGQFACSHPLLNQLYSNIVWGQKGNFLEAPTDCPQRDERLGWTGDAQIFIRTATLNRNVDAFFRKWFRDLRDAQQESGAIPMVVPSLDISSDDAGPAWSDAQIICPHTHYLAYGDPAILEAHYPSMQRYFDHLLSLTKDHIRCHPDTTKWGGFGDWLAQDNGGKTSGRTLTDLIGTAFLAQDARLLADIARILGKSDDQSRYNAHFAAIRTAFQHRFVTADAYIAGHTQTAYALALHFDLLPPDLRPLAANHLARLIRDAKNHLTTGFVGTPYLCKVLEETGHLDLAYTLLEQTTFPSWLFPVTNGATTIWERWDSWTPEKGFHPEGMNSFNHYGYGAIGAWMFSTVAGIDATFNLDGQLAITYRPRPGGTLTHAEASLDTPHGKAAIRWEKSNDHLVLQVEVPSNTHATFDPPAGFHPPDPTVTTPGLHRFTLNPL